MAVIALYLVLGTFMEELSMMISTIPITTPLMVQAGYDSIWYGVLIVLLIQTAMISPPFGINLFVIQGIRGRGRLSDVEWGSAPFVIALLIMIAIICIWPETVMWAPRVVRLITSSITIFPAASSSARAPGGTRQVASYSSTMSGPGAAAAQIAARDDRRFAASHARRNRPDAALASCPRRPTPLLRHACSRAGLNPTSWIATSSTGSSGPARWP